MKEKITSYKLIKEYPGSPEMGTEVTTNNKGQYFSKKPFFIFNYWEVERHPEFWEPVYKKALEVGRWYKVLFSDGDINVLFYLEKQKENKLYGYGFNCYENWEWENDGMAWWSLEEEEDGDKIIPATNKEVEKALIIEAKKRGFKEGVDHTQFNGEGRTKAKGEIISGWRGRADILHFSKSQYLIFQDGQWAEIISKPEYPEKIKLKNASLWESLGNVVNTGTGKYMFLPYWIKKADNGEEFELYRLGDNLPPDLENQLKLSRGIE